MLKIQHMTQRILLTAVVVAVSSILAAQQVIVPLAGNVFQTAGEQRERITANGIVSWQYAGTEFSVYINCQEPGTFNLTLKPLHQQSDAEITIANGKTVRNVVVKQNQESVSAGSFAFTKGYNRIVMKGIKKYGTHYASLSELIIEGTNADQLNFIRDNNNGRFHFGRRGPSVHLGYSLPDNRKFKWFYNEIVVPEGEDPIGSYFMANGFGEGYFGIQVNSPTERRILFSVWSPFNTDNPKEIPDDQKIVLLAKGQDVNTGEFGNEGSGGQSFLRYRWKAGTIYRFLNSIEPDGKGNTVYTAYFFDPQQGDWKLIARFKRPKTNTWYSRPHSFLENFSPENGYKARRVFFQNQWACDSAGNWVELTRARFTGDDIANIQYRLDRDGGLDGNRFYLQNGGFINYTSKLNSMHERPALGQKPAFNPATIEQKLTGKHKKPINIADFAGWQRIEQRLISSDGNIVMYETKAQKGDGMLVVYNARRRQYDTIPNGFEAQIAANSEFAVFKLRLPEDSLRKLKMAKTKKEDMPKDAIGVFNFANRQFQRLDSVKSHLLPAENGSWLTYLREGPKKNKKPTYKLIIWDPVSDRKHTIEQADTFAIASKGNAVALLTSPDSLKLKSLIVVWPDENGQGSTSTGQKTGAHYTTTFTTDTLLTDSLHIRRLTFDDAGKQLAWLASRDSASSKNYSLYYYRLAPQGKRKQFANSIRLVADSLATALPRGWSPSVNGSLYFSDDGSKLFFGSAQKIKPVEKDSLLAEEKAKLELWSHTDNILKPRQLKQEAQKKRQTFLAVYRVADNKVVQLADSVVETIRLMHGNNGELAIGTDRKPHERSITWSSRMLTDYYLVDLKTGQKTTLLKGGQHLQLSPTARFVAWFDPDQRHYYTRELATGATQAISTSLRVALTDELHDTPDDPSPYGVAGWTNNDEHLIVYDRYDLWLLDPLGKAAPVNLTNGRSQQLRYRYIATDTKKATIGLSEPLLLSMVNENSYVEGFAALQAGTTSLSGSKGSHSSKSNSGSRTKISVINPVVTPLISGSWSVGSVVKAANSDALLWSRQTVDRFPEVELSSLNFGATTVVSATNRQQAEFVWPTVELVKWNSFAGDSLRGLLYKPENFDPAKKYPMIVYFYERSSDTYHRYNYPQPSRSIISIPFYVSNEYLVFVPDIVYTTGYPGKNAYDAIVSGVQSLLNTRSYIDEKALGLQGQSWGGYQIAYLITQTDMFAAAMAGAPVSNMTSAYGGIRWGTGMSRMFQYENTQSRIGGTLWERPLLYLENSPVFHAPRVNTPLLMMHNDNDGAVPWYQGIEYFMALYRLGKPVWMLNYNGMDHNIEAKYWANRIDLSTKMAGFFNYYLKKQEQPQWMK
jgi:dipeptidyl aminopeptidase/acylaminoacyl peptidase